MLLDAAWNAGIRYFDTAPFYGHGLSERRVGDFLRVKPTADYVISTKVGRLLVPDRDFAIERFNDRHALPFRPVFDFTYDGIMRSFEQSLQRLGLEKIDILLLHDIGRFSQGANHEANLKIALDGGVKAMLELKAQGVVKAIGLGVNEWEICDEMMNHASWDCFLLAGRYTLLDQTALETFLPRCEAEGVSIIVGGPLNSGILGSGTVPGARYNYAPAPDWIMERVDRIEAVCKAEGVIMPAAALAFPLGHKAIAAIIPGFATLSDLTTNMQHLATPMPASLWDSLRSAGLLDSAAPIPETPILRG